MNESNRSNVGIVRKRHQVEVENSDVSNRKRKVQSTFKGLPLKDRDVNTMNCIRECPEICADSRKNELLQRSYCHSIVEGEAHRTESSTRPEPITEAPDMDNKTVFTEYSPQSAVTSEQCGSSVFDTDDRGQLSWSLDTYRKFLQSNVPEDLFNRLMIDVLNRITPGKTTLFVKCKREKLIIIHIKMDFFRRLV